MLNRTVRILVVDDDREDAERVVHLLEGVTKGWIPELTWVSTYEEGVEALAGGEADVCLLDYELGARSGLDFLREPRVRVLDVPIILLTGLGGGAVDQEAGEAGAVDYLEKGHLSPEGLERAIRYAVEGQMRRRAEARLGAVMAHSREVIWVLSRSGRIFYLSPSSRRVLGREPEDLMGRRAIDEIHPDDQAMVEGEFRELLENPSLVLNLRARVRHAGGGWRVMDAVVENHVDDPSLGGVLLSSWDVTERLEQERHIRFQANLLDAVGQALIATDPDGVVTYMNPAAERLYGWSAAEVVGREVLDVTVPELRKEEAAEIMEALGRGESWSGEFMVRRRDGTSFPALVTNAPLLDEGGSLVGIIGVSSDITDLKETQAQLHERVKELRTLYTATEILQRQELPLQERLQVVVEAIPPGFLYPDVTEARLMIDGSAVVTPGFRETEWMQSVQVVSDGQTPGRLEVALTEPRPEVDVGPFLNEELDLLETLATTVATALERYRLQRYLSLIFVNLSEGVLVVDPSDPGRPITMVNPAIERMFGFTAEEMLGRSVEMLHVDHEAYVGFAEEYLPVLSRGEVFRGTLSLRRKDGTVFEAQQTITFLDFAKGPEGGVMGVIRDVSEAAKAERELRRSEERFRQITEHIQDVFWVSAPDKRRIEYVSPAYAHIWGRAPDELYEDALSWTDHIHPGDRERVREAAVRQAEGGYEEEYRIVRPDGTVRWIKDRAFPVEGADGSVERIIGVAEDVTERHRAEARLSALVREISDVLFVIDPEGWVSYASPSIEGIVGYSPEEFEGTNALDLLVEGDREDAQAVLGGLTSKPGETVRTQYRARAKDGTVRHMESFVRNLLEDPAVNGVLITSRDVTERVKLEERLRVTQRIESIGRLAGGVAHDFNNLLTVIRSQSDLLLMDLGEGHELAPEVEVIQGVADRAAALTSQLLSFSRGQILRPSTIDLADAVRTVGPLIERMIGEKIMVEYDLDDDCAPVLIDPLQLEQVVLNLAVNALDAMPSGGELSLSICSESVDEARAARLPGLSAGRYTVLRVTDTGIGMDEDTRTRAFEPFFTTKDRGKGTGLGLAMAYGFVTQSGGSIHLDSSPGEGATFSLYFPGAEGEVEALAAPRGSLRTSGAISGTILLVEDDPNVRRVTRKIFERAGFIVLEVANAEAALEILAEETNVDLLMSDLVLPGLGGRDLIDRAAELRSDLPVLLTSGYASSSREDPGDLPPEVPFIRKPFSPEGLVTAARRAIEGTG